MTSNERRAEPDSLGRSERGAWGVRRSTPQNAQSGRVTFGKDRHTGTPQKCSPSVQVGVMRE